MVSGGCWWRQDYPTYGWGIPVCVPKHHQHTSTGDSDWGNGKRDSGKQGRNELLHAGGKPGGPVLGGLSKDNVHGSADADGNSGVNFSIERWAEFEEEFKSLSVEHWREVALHQKEVPLDLDFDVYKRGDESGKLVFVAARKNGVLVGYSIWAVVCPLHFKSTLYAQNDVIYMLPKYRGNYGLSLIKHSEIFMVSLGVKKILWGVMRNRDWSKILERMGYEQEDILMSKVVS